jgi:hypothetical protein
VFNFASELIQLRRRSIASLNFPDEVDDFCKAGIVYLPMKPLLLESLVVQRLTSQGSVQ